MVSIGIIEFKNPSFTNYIRFWSNYFITFTVFLVYNSRCVKLLTENRQLMDNLATDDLKIEK